jgi:hypothetical protein
LIIGADILPAPLDTLLRALPKPPDNWSVLFFYPGHSTSIRHGGVHPACDGGALRTILSYLANSRYVAYLDDDNWWEESHLSSLLTAVEGHDWSYSLRWFVEPGTSRPLAVDVWESVGPGQGVYTTKFGGYADPNTLLIDKVACERALGLWTRPLPKDKTFLSADRSVFAYLSTQHKGRGTGKTTCFYSMNPKDMMHPKRMARIKGPPVTDASTTPT